MKNVLISGGSRGIGRAMVYAFIKEGYKVSFLYKSNEQAAKEVADATGALAIRCDVSSPDEVKQALEKVGEIDILINNAGISVVNLLTDTTLEEWEKLFSINVTGTFLASKYAAKEMIKNHSGKIINISSIWGVSGACMESCYSASKGAVIAFTKALAKELGPSGITVNCVAPGFIDTDMNSDVTEEDRVAFCEETPLGRIGTPEEVANTVLFLASDNASFITGQIISCDGGVIV